jgi:hypothetical protein
MFVSEKVKQQVSEHLASLGPLSEDFSQACGEAVRGARVRAENRKRQSEISEESRFTPIKV